jgi:hypothetical protein
MVVFHHQGDEVDFVARASRAFLKDHAMDLLTQEWSRTLPSNGAL